jgi:hypothetical protein
MRSYLGARFAATSVLRISRAKSPGKLPLIPGRKKPKLLDSL